MSKNCNTDFNIDKNSTDLKTLSYKNDEKTKKPACIHIILLTRLQKFPLHKSVSFSHNVDSMVRNVLGDDPDLLLLPPSFS